MYSEKTKNFLKRIIKDTKRGIIFLLVIFLLVPMSLVLIYSYSVTTQYVWMGNIASTFLVTLSLIIILIIIFLSFSELIFLATYYLINKKFYKRPEKVSIEKIYVQPNPHLTYILKPGYKNEESKLAEYPLNENLFYYGQYTTNKMGYLNGIDGSRDILIPKPKNLYRINCLGASTTGNYLNYQDKDFSYPLELENILISKDETNIEVNNFGIGGYNSSDILINYMLNIIDTKPDMIILYHAYNDISAYLTHGIKSDFSHSRKNFGESFWKFKFSEMIPNTPFSFINFIFEKWFPVSPRNSLLDQVRKGDIDLDKDPSQGLEIYKRNIQTLIDICKTNNTCIILSTFCFYLYPEIADIKLHKTYQRIVSMENDIMRKLAIDNNLQIVDNAKLIPKHPKYFVDSIHFSPFGMTKVAENFAKIISPSIKNNSV